LLIWFNSIYIISQVHPNNAIELFQKFKNSTLAQEKGIGVRGRGGGGEGQRGLKHGMFIGQVLGLDAHMWESMSGCFRLSDTFRMYRSNNIGFLWMWGGYLIFVIPIGF
jgi:hypothetical protein